MNENRNDRQIAFFGEAGQQRLSNTTVTVIGAGGLGSHVVQQLAYLGVGKLIIVDKEQLGVSNLNRYVTARHDDPVPGTEKVDIAKRLVTAANPAVAVEKVKASFISDEGFAAVGDADVVFGCLDGEGARLVLTELCSAYAKPYIDLASDVLPGQTTNYGGRICIAWDGTGCLVCLDVLDVAEAQRDLAGPDRKKIDEAIYGVNRKLLNRSGPSVVSINGVVASLAVTEFIVGVTGIRPPKRMINFRGELGKVTIPESLPKPGCYLCSIRGQGATADVEHYIRDGIGIWV